MIKKRPIADQLADILGGKWKAIRDGMSWYYKCSDDRVVRPYSESILGYDGYSDDNFQTVYYDNSGNRIPIGYPLFNLSKNNAASSRTTPK